MIESMQVHRAAGARARQRVHRRGSTILLVLLMCAIGGCAGWGPATSASNSWETRRAAVEVKIRELGVAEHPIVEARRSELAAAVAEEGQEVAIDSVELRTQISDGRSMDVGVRARLPLENLFERPARREARRAASDAALQRLRAAGKERRAAQCLPALDRQTRTERLRIYERYSTRQKTLRTWNRQLEEAGLVDEISSTRFELSSQMRLDTRAPAELPAFAAAGDPAWAKVLPEPDAEATAVDLDQTTVRRLITEHHPEWQVERALARRYRALADAARASRMPHLKFFDLSFDPASGANPSEFGAQVGVEIPFGRAAHAREQSALAMARSHESRSKFVLEGRFLRAEAALYELRAFQSRGAGWYGLLRLADRSEEVADRWQRERLSQPGRISALLDDVYDTRMAVLAERERAGLAGCSILAATGTPVDAWPRRPAPTATEVGSLGGDRPRD